MLLSVILRVFCDAYHLELLLKCLRAQQVDFDFEIIVVDNESTDNARQVAEAYGCRIVILERNNFSYGRSANVGVQHALGEVALIMSSHIFLPDPLFLHRAMKLWRSQPVAAIRCTNVSKVNLLHASFAPAVLRYAQKPPEQSDTEFFRTQWSAMIIGNCSFFSVSLARTFPFNEVVISNEEKEWSMRILKAGHGIMHQVPLYFVYTKVRKGVQRARHLLVQEISAADVLGTPAYTMSHVKYLWRAFKNGTKQVFRDYWANVFHAWHTVQAERNRRNGRPNKRTFTVTSNR